MALNHSVKHPGAQPGLGLCWVSRQLQGLCWVHADTLQHGSVLLPEQITWERVCTRPAGAEHPSPLLVAVMGERGGSGTPPPGPVPPDALPLQSEGWAPPGRGC